MREFASDFVARPALSPAVRAASATGGAVDRIGYDALSILVSTGAWTDGTHTIVVEDSEDGTTFAAVPAGLLSAALPVVDGAGKANAATLVGYSGDARFVRVKANVTGSPATGAVVGALVLLGNGRNRPAGSRTV